MFNQENKHILALKPKTHAGVELEEGCWDGFVTGHRKIQRGSTYASSTRRTCGCQSTAPKQDEKG